MYFLRKSVVKPFHHVGLVPKSQGIYRHKDEREGVKDWCAEKTPDRIRLVV
jgi:hypothetical protein